MDAAAAAAKSDPDRNRHFRRRWVEAEHRVSCVAPRFPARAIGTLGLALLEAMERRRSSGQADFVPRDDGEPSR